jgi:hypothetical protein
MRLHALIALALVAGGCAGQQAIPPPGPPRADLGTPPEALSAFSTDYRALVAAAMPRISEGELRSLLGRAVKEAAEDKPLAVRDVREWAALFGLTVDPAGAGRPGELIDAGNASYLVDTEADQFYMTVRRPGTTPVTRSEFAGRISAMRRAHEALADRIGIPRRQIFFVDFREILAQSTPRPQLAGARESAVETVAATTTLLRAVAGMLIDGSAVRMTSVDADRLEMVDVRWPSLRLAPEVALKDVVSPARLADRVVSRLTTNEGGKPVNVLMAVVLRPLRANHRIYFIPSLRVGVLPKSEARRDGYRTDAGAQFYLDLIAGMEDLADREEREPVPESLERSLEPQRPR